MDGALGRGQRDAGRIAPQPFELVEVPLARMEYMYDEVHEIEQCPAALGEALGVVGANPRACERFHHVIGDGANVGVRCAGRDHEEVRRVAQPTQVQHDDVLRLAVGERIGRPLHVPQGRLPLLSAPGPGLFLTSYGVPACGEGDGSSIW